MTQSPKSPSAMIDDRIASLGDWRAPALARVRALIKEEDPEVVEAWKWMGTPVWEHAGILSAGGSYKTAVKLNQMKPAKSAKSAQSTKTTPAKPSKPAKPPKKPAKRR